MKRTCFGKKIICALLGVLLLAIVSCDADVDGFTETKDGTLVDAFGEEYVLFAHEGRLNYLGDLEFQGSVKGEQETLWHLGMAFQTGLFAVKNDDTKNILIRYKPNSEWYQIYRKKELKPFDISVDSCIRLELVVGGGNTAVRARLISAAQALLGVEAHKIEVLKMKQQGG